MHFSEQTSRELHFKNIVEADEEIIWVGKPKLIPYCLNGLANDFFYVSLGALVSLAYWNRRLGPAEVVIGWSMSLIFLLFFVLKTFLSFRNTSYALTSKRIVIRSGFFTARDEKIDFTRIVEADFRINLIGDLFNAGTIKFFSGRTYNNEGTAYKIYARWAAIANPSEVFGKLKRVAGLVNPAIAFLDLRDQTPEAWVKN